MRACLADLVVAWTVIESLEWTDKPKWKSESALGGEYDRLRYVLRSREIAWARGHVNTPVGRHFRCWCWHCDNNNNKNNQRRLRTWELTVCRSSWIRREKIRWKCTEWKAVIISSLHVGLLQERQRMGRCWRDLSTTTRRSSWCARRGLLSDARVLEVRLMSTWVTRASSRATILKFILTTTSSLYWSLAKMASLWTTCFTGRVHLQLSYPLRKHN